MKIKSLGIVVCLSFLLSSLSAAAATFTISKPSIDYFNTTQIPQFSSPLDLLDGQSRWKDTGVEFQAIVGSDPLDGDDYDFISMDITVQSGVESVTKTGDFKGTTSYQNTGSGSFDYLAQLALSDDLIFDFSFGQFTLLAGIILQTECLDCNQDVVNGNIYLKGSFTEISAVPLPAGLPMMLGALVVLGLVSRWKKTNALP